MKTSSTDGSVIDVEASESLAYSEAVELVEVDGDCPLRASEGVYLDKSVGSSGMGLSGCEVDDLGRGW